jgi:osmoprotectant transport system substrate-binding protein
LTPPSHVDTAWAVRAETAKKYQLTKLSDLQPVAHQLTIGGPPELAVRALGLPGLKRVYGLEFKAVKSLDMGGPLTRLALNSGKIDVATVVSTRAIWRKRIGWSWPMISMNSRARTSCRWCAKPA